MKGGANRSGPAGPAKGKRRAFFPRDIAGCVAWLRADLDITLGGTLVATGTTPPVVLVAGTGPALNLRVEITTGGTLGTAVFRWSADGGSTWDQSTQATAATFTLTGRGYGFVLTFPAGTYTNDNVYVGRVASWVDQSGFANTPVQATAANQPTVAMAALNSRPVMRFSADRARRLDWTSAVSVGTQCTIIMGANLSGASGYLISDSAANTAFLDNFTANAYEWFNGADRYTMGTSATGFHVLATSHINGGALLGYFDGAATFTQTAAVAIAGLKYLGNTNTLTNGASDIAEVIVYNRALSAADVLRVSTYLKIFWGL